MNKIYLMSVLILCLLGVTTNTDGDSRNHDSIYVMSSMPSEEGETERKKKSNTCIKNISSQQENIKKQLIEIKKQLTAKKSRTNKKLKN